VQCLVNDIAPGGPPHLQEACALSRPGPGPADGADAAEGRSRSAVQLALVPQLALACVCFAGALEKRRQGGPAELRRESQSLRGSAALATRQMLQQVEALAEAVSGCAGTGAAGVAVVVRPCVPPAL
jgi:hypothetical protein